MIIEVTRDADYVHAMGHRVALGQDAQRGEAELRRRCFESLAHLTAPPESVAFAPVGAMAIARELGPEPESAPEPEPPDAMPPRHPSSPPSAPVPRSHKKKT